MNAEHQVPIIDSDRRRLGWRLLSWLWLFPSLGAVVVLCLSLRSILAQPTRTGIPIPVDGLVALLILISHLVWIYLARRSTPGKSE